jgi:type I restriction enzyme S subunit
MVEITAIYSNEIKDRFEARHYINFAKIKDILHKYKYLTIKEITTLKGGNTPSTHFREYCASKIYKECFPFIKSTNIKKGVLDLTNLSFIDKEAHRNLLKASVVKPFDILIAMTGTVGAVALTPSIIEEANISQNVVRIRINEEWKSKISPEYLLAVLNSNFGQVQIQGLLTSTNQKYLNQIEIGKIKIPLLGELNKGVKIYKKINFYENKAYLKIAQAKQIFEEEVKINPQEIKEEKIYSVNSDDLTDTLTPKFYYPKYLNTLKQLGEKFKTVKLGDIAEIKQGDEVGSENYKRYIDKQDSDVSFIRTSDLVNYEIDNYPDYYIDEEIYNELNQDLREGDILYTKDGKIGLSAIVTGEDKCIIASGVARIRVKKELDPYYLFLVLSTEIGLYQALQRTVIAATLPHLRPERVAEFEIPLIGSEKQKRISNLVEEAFELKTVKKKLIKEVINKVENLLQ